MRHETGMSEHKEDKLCQEEKKDKTGSIYGPRALQAAKMVPITNHQWTRVWVPIKMHHSVSTPLSLSVSSTLTRGFCSCAGFAFALD